MINFYADMGINRVSFGIQDFNIEVQEAVNRVQSIKCIENLLTPGIRSRFKNGVNFDIICGLPKQTLDSIRNTCYEIIRLSPDRICLNYLHYSPEMAKHQKLMGDLPDFIQRKELFSTALEVLTLGGYVRTGYDHFAKPTDANAKATIEGNVVWNSMGTTPGRVQDVIGVGVSSISNIGNHYFQNFYELADYEAALDSGKFPIQRGHTMSEDDIARRDIIQSLRNYFATDVIGFWEELELLREFQRDKIVTLSGTKVTIVQPEYANLVCRVFDKFYNGKHFAPDLGER
jgi:oxygen-independent coproporphyrinogen-3 oxidase